MLDTLWNLFVLYYAISTTIMGVVAFKTFPQSEQSVYMAFGEKAHKISMLFPLIALLFVFLLGWILIPYVYFRTRSK